MVTGAGGLIESTYLSSSVHKPVPTPSQQIILIFIKVFIARSLHLARSEANGGSGATRSRYW